MGQCPAGIVLGEPESRVYDRRSWATRAEAMTAVGDWIERVYNRRRRHSALKMLSPVRFEELHRQMAEAA